jgi:peptidyl-prolyl cis-trans isomerase D
MIGFLRRHRQPLILAIVVIFVIGIFVGLGGYFFTGADTTEAVAMVDGSKIPYLRYRARVDQYLESQRAQDKEVTDQMTAEVKSEMLRDMIVNELLAGRAEEMGLKVSDTELALTIQQNPGFQDQGRFNQGLYMQAVRLRFKTTPIQYERAQRRDLQSARLKALMFRTAKVLPGELRAEYLRTRAGKVQEFDAKKAQFSQALRQQRALDAINFYLKQRAANADIRTFLAQREQGL